MIYPKITIDDMKKYSADMYIVDQSKNNISQEEQAFARTCYGMSTRLAGFLQENEQIGFYTLGTAETKIQPYIDKIVKEFVDKYVAPIIANFELGYNKEIKIPSGSCGFCGNFEESFIAHCLNVNGYKLNTDKRLQDSELPMDYDRKNFIFSTDDVKRNEKTFNYDKIKHDLLSRDENIIGKRGSLYIKNHIIHYLVGDELHRSNEEWKNRTKEQLRETKRIIEEIEVCYNKLKKISTFDENEYTEELEKIKEYKKAVEEHMTGLDTPEKEDYYLNNGLAGDDRRDLERKAKRLLGWFKSRIEIERTKETEKNRNNFFEKEMDPLINIVISKDEQMRKLIDSSNKYYNESLDLNHRVGLYIKKVTTSDYKRLVKDAYEHKKELNKFIQEYDTILLKVKNKEKTGNSQPKTKKVFVKPKELISKDKPQVEVIPIGIKNNQKIETQEIVDNQEDLKVEEPSISAEIKEEKPKEKAETLRQKFDIESEEDFNKLLSHYAKANKEYYSNNGKKRTEEEIKKRRNMNAQFKRILEKKAKQMPQNENGEEFTTTLKSIEKGEMFSQVELKEVAENKNATMKLFNIMASGVYERGGERIRLTQKQRVALASTLEKVSEIRLDMDNSKRANKETTNTNINHEEEATKTVG